MAHEVLESVLMGSLVQRVNAAANLMGQYMDGAVALSEEDASIIQTTLWDVRKHLTLTRVEV